VLQSAVCAAGANDRFLLGVKALDGSWSHTALYGLCHVCTSAVLWYNQRMLLSCVLLLSTILSLWSADAEGPDYTEAEWQYIQSLCVLSNEPCYTLGAVHELVVYDSDGASLPSTIRL